LNQFLPEFDALPSDFATAISFSRQLEPGTNGSAYVCTSIYPPEQNRITEITEK
jgi:hypothetical protein